MKTPKPIEINVTQNDINRGVEGSCRHCPIALAANRALRKHYKFDSLVVSDIIEIFFKGRRVKSFSMPYTAHAFITTFDLHGDVKPFFFHLP